MTTPKEQIVAYARETLGTQTAHQGRLLGKAMDCVGVPVHVASRIGMDISDVTNYGRIPNPVEMRAKLDEHLVRVLPNAMQIGDVVWLSVEQDPQHLGIICDYPYSGGCLFGLIHAHNASGVKKVVEHRLDKYWRDRIRAVWRFPGVK